MKSGMTDEVQKIARLSWYGLPRETRELLRGKLAGLWGAESDEAAFDSLAIDKQQAVLLLLQRLQQKNLWSAIRKINNVYGEGGVGIDFFAWPYIESMLARRSDFTRRFAKRKTVSGGFYEKGPRQAVLHFLYQTADPKQWHVHFDLYNPLYSPASAFRHIRDEYLSKNKPDWIAISRAVKNDARNNS